MTVSIIVPIYRGKKYLGHILHQVEKCVQNIADIEVELILYNDFPDEEIYVGETGYSYNIKVINPGFNSGIHGARVRGLENAKGEYVLFLDQDDKISPVYLKEQMKCIGEADAVVCRAIHNNRLHYTATHVFEEVISKDFMLQKWCPIVSPGQVLIKSTSIPRLWKEKLLKNNGADDYFLWLLMAAEEKIFALNQGILFEHIVTGMNTSGDTNKMMDSEIEMIGILKENHVFQGEDEKYLSGLPDSLRRIHIKELDNYKKICLLLQYWNMHLSNGIPPLDFFERNHIRTVAIYGAGELGRSIEVLLRNTDVKVCFYIDRNAEYIMADLPVYRKENIKENVDAVIISIKSESVKSDIKRLAGCPVYEIEEIWA